MALAILEPAGTDAGVRRFRGHIGANRYYGYIIGSETRSQRGRGRFVEGAHHRSKLFGPIPRTAHGRIEIEVPARLFDREHRKIQLFSFRTSDLVGPAWSDVVTVAPATFSRVGGGHPDAGLPPLTQETQESAMTTVPATPDSRRATDSADNVDRQYVEAPLASAQFLGVIGKLLPSILPMAGDLLGAIGGGARGEGNGNGKSPLAGLGSLLGSEDFQQKLLSFIDQVASSQATAQGLSYDREELRRAVARAQSTDGPDGGYAEAQVAPALLAALPALAPLLKQVLDPQTLKSISDGVGPNKLTGMVVDGIQDLAKLGIASHEQDLKHLRELNPGVDDESLSALLASLSASTSTRDHEPRWRRLRSVSLEFTDVSSESIHGRDRVMYALGGDLGFPLTLSLPDRKGKRLTIPEAVLQIAIKDPESRRVLAGRRMRLEDLQSGGLPRVPTLRAERLGRLRSGEDYLVTATLTFRRRRRNGRVERVGTSRSMLITAVRDAIFDRVEGSRGLVPLDDPDRHRAFWHKLWQGTFDRELRRVTWATRYVYTLEPDRERNGRLKTLTRVDDRRVRHEVGKLKSGMELSPGALNGLLETLEGHRPLTEGELEALQASELRERFQQAARGRIEIDADPGRSGALWLWPEVKLLEVVLRVPGEPDAHGRVRTTDERTVVFPMPAMVHLVAVRTGETEAGEDTVGGMRIVSDTKVALYSTRLAAVPDERDQSDGRAEDRTDDRAPQRTTKRRVA